MTQSRERRTQRGPRSGFSLVELMVVTGILATLAGILLPIFARVRERGREASCTSNLRQLGAALLLYAQDYDERFPTFLAEPLAARHAGRPDYWHDRFCSGLELEVGQRSWIDTVEPYLRAPRIAFCPSDGKPSERPITSYEYKPGLAQGIAMGDLWRPSGVAALYEPWGYHARRESEYDPNARSLVVFADGHLAAKRLADSTSARHHGHVNLHWLHNHDTGTTPCAGDDFVP